MVSAVGTSASPFATASFNGRKIDRCQDGTLWVVVLRNVTAANGSGQVGLEFFYSKNNGMSWTSSGSATGSSIPFANNPSLFIDQDDYLHLVFKQPSSDNAGAAETGGARSAGYLYYMRGTPNAGRTGWTWSTAFVVYDANTFADYPDVVAHREGTGWRVHAVTSYLNAQNQNLVPYTRFAITSGGAITVENNTGTIATSVIGGHTYPSIDFNHTGDGKTVAGGTPHLYVGWTAGATGAGKGVRFRKAVYSDGAWTWNPEREIDPDRARIDAEHWFVGFFDGVDFMIAARIESATNDAIRLYQCNAADTITSTLLTVNDVPPGSLGYGSATYDGARNVYFFFHAGPTGGALTYRRWTRATSTFGSAITLDATGNTAPYISAKRGSQPGNSIEVVYTDGTASPYTVQYDRTVPDVNAPATPYVPAILL